MTERNNNGGLAVRVRGLQKKYPDFTLGPIDLTVPSGSIVGLVGENGAGKTITLKPFWASCAWMASR